MLLSLSWTLAVLCSHPAASTTTSTLLPSPSKNHPPSSSLRRSIRRLHRVGRIARRHWREYSAWFSPPPSSFPQAPMNPPPPWEEDTLNINFGLWRSSVCKQEILKLKDAILSSSLDLSATGMRRWRSSTQERCDGGGFFYNFSFWLPRSLNHLQKIIRFQARSSDQTAFYIFQ